MVVKQSAFYSSITSANLGGGVYVCADNTDAGGSKFMENTLT